MITFSNPRLTAEFSDWNIGSGDRGQCKFTTEFKKGKGWRAVRQTTDKHGRWCKPKTATYGGKLAIVDGSDGKTYILQYSPYNDQFISASDSAFMSPELEKGKPGSHTAFGDSNPELFKEWAALIEQANK